MKVTALILLVTCELCLAIRVPASWDDSASEVKQEIKINNDEQFSVESFKPQTVNQNAKPIPVEYFEYKAKKPQFAIDVASYHGVQSPESHYKSYPIKPYTGVTKPEIGKHLILDKGNSIHKPLQEYASQNDDIKHAVPVSTNYEVYHPYQAEVPALQEIYKDPILNKIRNNLENSKNRLQHYEKEAGEPDISKDEYLESPEKTDSKFFPHRNVPAPYEIHRPQRRPVYYRPGPKPHHREEYLNQRLRHPWNQHGKIRPMHYRPVKHHLHQLRQNHAMKYDDERNEYPQVHVMESYSDPTDGYDIYERGQNKFVQLRNNVDESINNAVKQNRPATYEKLEIKNNDSENNEEENEDEFIPIKNYAQVRKTETFRHLPKSAALEDAESYEEIRNAPRLREAVKSTKSQTVYSEEGYEDAGYDHAGEQKHASEIEGHGGYLKQHELSGGKYKTPSVSASYEDGRGSAYRDQVIHAEKWKDNNEDKKEAIDEEDYSEDEHEHSIEADNYRDKSPEDVSYRNKREYDTKNDTNNSSTMQIDMTNKSISQHDVDKRDTNFEVPELDLNSTFLTEQEIIKLGQIKIEPKQDDMKQKYPYYYKNLQAISKHSPLRYAENLKLIPKKSKGGTEFYDSRTTFVCPEVDDVPDPLPDKLKKDGHPDENDEADDDSDSSTKGDENFDTAKKTPRLKDLGDKIDCFKAKYFGENPLDSPFFREDIIANPEPLILPNVRILKSKHPIAIKNQSTVEWKTNNVSDNSEKLKGENDSDLFSLIEKLRADETKMQESLGKSNQELISNEYELKNMNNPENISITHQTNVYTDILDNIKNNSGTPKSSKKLINITDSFTNPSLQRSSKNITYSSFQNKEDIMMSPLTLRKKRSVPFIYEPYKIIRDSQVQDSKKTTTSSNISPLIKQLQSSRFVDIAAKPSQDAEPVEKHVKRNVNTRMYKDISQKDRIQIGSKNDKGVVDTTFVDVSVDKRRGEPRYETRHSNHKTRYTPVENKKFMTIEDYKAQANAGQGYVAKQKGEKNIGQQSRLKITTNKPYFDIFQSIPQTTEVQNTASSNTVKKTISTTAIPIHESSKNKNINDESSESDEDYEEYDDDEDEEDEEEESVRTTTTTTQKPSLRQRIRTSTTTENLPDTTERPKLRLVTRFRDYKPDERSDTKEHPTENPARKNQGKEYVTQDEVKISPKYREKKKKTTKSTLVTDTKRYGDDHEHDMRKEEVDSMIGVKEDMNDYVPLYEKDEDSKFNDKPTSSDKIRDNGDNDNNDEDDDEEEEDSENDDDDDDDDDDDEDDEEEHDEDEREVQPQKELQPTTPEPTKRTLVITTDAPVPTAATRNAKLKSKPIVTRKKIEIHKELPVNRSSPHVSQYKQDIKEVEIVKEILTKPKPKLRKNIEALELYKDDNLAKDINKLGGVEVFKENFDLNSSPRHGGNYRSIDEASSTTEPIVEMNMKPPKEDAEASQSEFTKQIELDDDIPGNQMHGGHIKIQNEAPKGRSKGRNSKLIEFDVTPSTTMHGGNLKYRGRERNNRSQKYIELDDEREHDDDSSSDSREDKTFGSSSIARPLHGGNYRSAKIVEAKATEVSTTRPKAKNSRQNSAVLLNSFAQAVPILTTTPGYILDPSKRMYYYVD